MSGADVMDADVARRFKKMGATVSLPVVGSLGEAAFVEGYGMVELGGGAAAKISPPFLSAGLGDALGFPLPSWQMRVVDDDGNDVRGGDVGELLVKGPGLAKGYWNAPEATAATITQDGWLRTGDLAKRGPFGIVQFAGRAKDVIVSGGYTVYAVEVEQALCEHADVLEAAVVALPDERLGEVPAAALRVVEGSELDERALRAWAEEHLAHYKVPRRVVVVDDLPRTGTEKVQKRALLALFA
jgi:acyl-CoA synthetase (AMP-forming)/AMP-acid ligase II